MSAEANKPATTGGVSKFCSQCGTRGEVDWKFCQQCGAKVGAGTHTDEEKTKYIPGAFTLKVDLPGGDREDMASVIFILVDSRFLILTFFEPSHICEMSGGKAKAPLFCSECGTKNSSGEVWWKFCKECGAKSKATIPSQFEEKLKYKAGELRSTLVLPGGARNDMAVRIGDRLVYDFEKQKDSCDGCGEFAPPLQLDAEMTNDEWQKLLLELDSDKLALVGCHSEARARVPPELEEKGIGEAEWCQWMQDLNNIQQTKAPSQCCVTCVKCFPLLCLQAVVCQCCALHGEHHYDWLPCCFGDWHSALRQWMDTVNSRLEPMGLFTKILTYKADNAPRSRMYPLRTAAQTPKDEQSIDKLPGYEMSFLVFALTAEESRVLEAESWNHDVVHESKCFAKCCISDRGRVC